MNFKDDNEKLIQYTNKGRVVTYLNNYYFTKIKKYSIEYDIKDAEILRMSLKLFF
jgi:hypothetical protein